MKRILYIISVFISMSVLHAQTAERPEKIMEEIMESISEKDLNLNDQSQIFDELIDFMENPLNINTMDKSDFEKLVFLSDLQIQGLLNYRQKIGPFSSKYQLQAIPGLQRDDIERLMIFTKIEPFRAIKAQKEYLSGQFILRDLFDLQKARAYTADSSSTSYQGNRHHTYARLQLQYGDHWSAGGVLDKDPGEKTLPPDFASAYTMYQGNQLLKTLIIGDYHANFGQGLALWTGTSMGKTSEPLSIRKRGKGFSKYSSSNEYAFFRGIATTLAYNQIELSVFASHKNIDADISYNSDSSLSIVASMPQTGYHRTENEIKKKNQLGQSTLGANIDYDFNKLSISLGGYYQQYDADSIATKELYQYTAYEKTKTSSYWFSYHYTFNKALIFGEIALDTENNPALINGILFRPTSQISLVLSHRHFSRQYYSPWGNAFSENASPAGESGYYLGITTAPLPKTSLSGYVDIFKSSWLKYNIDQPSHGYDISLQAQYNFNSRFKVYTRYREKEKSQNQSTQDLPDYNLVTTNTRKIRLHADFEAHPQWSIQTRVEGSFYKEEKQANANGILAYSGIKYLHKNLSCWLRYTIFDTDNYDTRLYAYENDLLYNFYTPAFQGEGSRIYAMIRYQLAKNIKVWFKAGKTRYTDRDEIGSGLQTISGQSRTNIRMQIQIKL